MRQDDRTQSLQPILDANMPEALQNDTKEQLEARVYGLSLRLKQTELLASFPVTKGQYYSDSFNSETNEWPMELAILPYVEDRLARSLTIATDLRKVLADNHAFKAELCGADEIVNSLSTLCQMPIDLRRARLYGASSSCQNVSQLLCGIQVPLLPLLEKVTAWVNEMAQISDMPSLKNWESLGREIIQFYDKRDRPELQNAEPEFFYDVIGASFDDTENEACDWVRRETVTRLIGGLSLRQDDLFPQLERDCPYQKWIVENELVPSDYTGWVRVEAGFWRRSYGSPSPQRPTALRDQLLLKWLGEWSSKEKTRWRVALAKRWNELDAEKQKSLAGVSGSISAETVKKAVQKAKAEAELRAKPHQDGWLF